MLSIRYFRRREEGDSVAALEIKKGFTGEVAFEKKAEPLDLMPS